MSPRPSHTPFVGVARRAKLGALLRIGPEPLSFAWSNPSRGLHLTAIGAVGEGGGDVAWLGTAPASTPPGPWLGGWAFDASRPWTGFPAERWVLPEVLAWWDGKEAWLAAFGRGGEVTEQALLARLDRVGELEPKTEPIPAARVDAPKARGEWTALVNGALGAIERGELRKVVCARTIEVLAQSPFVERAVLKALEARHPQCWSFLVRGDDGSAFVGASPETLCEIRGSAVRIDSLAGTAPKGEGARLLDDDKERREHDEVIRGIRECLSAHVSSLSVAAGPSIKSLANVDHLFTPIEATLAPGTRPLDVARELHPTPAVGGAPRATAVQWLASHEGFARGWYAGAVGTLGPGGLTLAVALRSALVRGDRATLFSGAGVVAGSDHEREWLETERKATAMLGALGVEGGAHGR